jgi:hypothetical protein
VRQRPFSVEASRSHTDTPHFSGPLWKSDQSYAETSISQHTDIHGPGGIRTRNPSQRATTGVSYWGAYVFLKNSCLRLVLCLFSNDRLVTHAPERSGTSVYRKRNYGHPIMKNVIVCPLYSHIHMDCPSHHVPEHGNSMP